MRDFEEIYSHAAERKGGVGNLESLLHQPTPSHEITDIPADRWLSCMAKCIFQAGFSWKVVDAKWDGFETAFFGFKIGRCSMLSGEEISELESDKSIIRNGQKIHAVLHNANFLMDIKEEHGDVSAYFSNWPREDYIGLLALLKARGSRLGGMTGQRVLRVMGIDSFVLTQFVIARLIHESVIDKTPTSKTAMRNIQNAFNEWGAQSGRSFTQMSQILAYSIDI